MARVSDIARGSSETSRTVRLTAAHSRDCGQSSAIAVCRTTCARFGAASIAPARRARRTALRRRGRTRRGPPGARSHRRCVRRTRRATDPPRCRRTGDPMWRLPLRAAVPPASSGRRARSRPDGASSTCCARSPPATSFCSRIRHSPSTVGARSMTASTSTVGTPAVPAVSRPQAIPSTRTGASELGSSPSGRADRRRRRSCPHSR